MLPFHLTPQLKKTLSRLEAEGATEQLASICAQVFPSDKESILTAGELTDPLGEHCHRITDRLVHQYKNRVLLLSTGRCFAYCRHCFRRDFAGRGEQWLSKTELDEVCKYISLHEEIEEILISGGDPLTVSDNELEYLFTRLREVNPRLLFRICTRALFFAPERFTPSLIHLLKNYKPLWLIPHINHPAEISRKFAPETSGALESLVNAGIPVQSQTVLLKGVNDDVSILHELFHELVCLGVKPGYLFQLDLAQGTSHFRVPLEEALPLYELLRKELSGLSTPVFAVDLPDGGGKFNLIQLGRNVCDTEVTLTEKEFIFTRNGQGGGQWKYPRN